MRCEEMRVAPLPEILAKRAKDDLFTRVVAFGSSNTERCAPGMHWFDLFEIAYKATHERVFTCINSGRGGDTAAELLERMNRDCLQYEPNVAIITIGGNDANPARGVTPTRFRDNLRFIVQRLRAIGCCPVLQTYYAPDCSRLDADYMRSFGEIMDIVRSVSNETGAFLVDHLARWERLRDHHYSIFERLMLDPMHLNEAGNLLLGHDLSRAFSLQCPEDPYYRESLATQALMDSVVAAMAEVASLDGSTKEHGED
jgi:lysophospholipase L1-like esterase